MVKDSLLNFYSEEQKKQLLNLHSASELTPQSPAAVVVPVDLAKPAPPPEVVEICEFARDYGYPGSSARICADKTSCSVSNYGNLEVYRICPTRRLRLKQKKEP